MSVHRLSLVGLPVEVGEDVDAQTLGRLALEEAEFLPPLAEVLPEGLRALFKILLS